MKVKSSWGKLQRFAFWIGPRPYWAQRARETEYDGLFHAVFALRDRCGLEGNMCQAKAGWEVALKFRRKLDYEKAVCVRFLENRGLRLKATWVLAKDPSNDPKCWFWIFGGLCVR